MRAASLFLVFVVAKVAMVAGHSIPLSPWTPLAYFWQDVLAAVVFAALEQILPKPASRVLYWALVLYAAINIPVARAVSSPLTWPMLRAARGLILIDVAVVLVGVGNLLLHSDSDVHQPKVLWDSLAWISGAVALLLTLSLLPAWWPWSKVATIEASEGGCDDTPEEAKGVRLTPGGVQLHAPDGTSYGDTESWGRHDQRELVDELRGVSPATGSAHQDQP